MLTKTISIKDLLREINQLGFNENDQALLLADAHSITIKKIGPVGTFAEFAAPIWAEAKQSGITPDDIDDAIHDVRQRKRQK